MHRFASLHLVWVCNIDDREFEFVYHFNNWDAAQRPATLLLAKPRNQQVSAKAIASIFRATVHALH